MSPRTTNASSRKRVAFIVFQLTRRNPAGSTLVDLVAALASRYDVTVYATTIDHSLLKCVRYQHVPSLKRGGVVAQLTSSYFGQLLPGARSDETIASCLGNDRLCIA